VTDGGLLTGDHAVGVALRKFSIDDLAARLAIDGQAFFRVGAERLVALLEVVDGKRELSVMRLD
jgi:hypothetical protein